jgi:hypothetical protein
MQRPLGYDTANSSIDKILTNFRHGSKPAVYAFRFRVIWRDVVPPRRALFLALAERRLCRARKRLLWGGFATRAATKR